MYREMYDVAGVYPDDIRGVGDLQRLPVVRKAEMRAVPENTYAANIDISKCMWMSTSGSDGSPLSLPFTQKDKARRVLKELRALSAGGFLPIHKMMLIIEPRAVVEKETWFQKLGLLRRKGLSLYLKPSEQLEWLVKCKPRVLYGYTSGICLLAEEAARAGVKLPFLKTVMTSAELLDPAVRKRITAGFGIEPTDFYGSMEFGWIAWECPEHQGYHVNSDCLIVECLRDGQPVGPGEEGEIVITNLQSDAAPLIRYATGDIGVWATDSCKCGRGLPLLKSIRGRMVDRIILPTGASLSPYMLTCAIDDIADIKRFQIVQDAQKNIIFNFVPLSGGEGTRLLIEERMREELGAEVYVDVRIVDHIEPGANGKFRVVKSDIGRECVRTEKIAA